MRSFKLACMLLLVTLASCAADSEQEQAWGLSSPDKRLAVTASIDGSAFAYHIRRDEKVLVGPSRAGLSFAEAQEDAVFGGDFGPLRITAVSRGRGRDDYVPVHGTRSYVNADYRSLLLRAQEKAGQRRKIDLEIRAYDEGVAFRLNLPPQPQLGGAEIAAENTSFAFPGEYKCLAVSHEQFVNSHEGPYRPISADRLAPGALYDLPLVCRTARGGETFALSESNIEDYSAAYLTGNADGPGVQIELTPLPRSPSVAVIPKSPEDGVTTPWRLIMAADRPEALLESTMVNALAAPSRVGEAGWIEPGKAAWGWWSGLLAPSVPDAGHNTATYARYIDFASRFGLPYVLLDHGWAFRSRNAAGAEVVDITRPRPGVDLRWLIEYAERRGVRLWLWVNWRALAPRMEEALALYRRLGIAGVKVDYLDRQDQEMIAFYHRLLSTAARHRLMVNIHGAMVPRGLNRTYPNLLTQEGVMGSEYNKWSEKITATHNVQLAYTRAIVGPMDYAPGGFRSVTPAQFEPRSNAPLVMTTRAHQLALTVVYPSPMLVLADAPVAYLDAKDRPAPGADFLKLVPTSWDETRALAGEFGRYIAVARRKGDTWYIGALNDGTRRTVILPLTFLGPGQWKVRSWTDESGGSAIGKKDGPVAIEVELAPNGGAVFTARQGQRTAPGGD